jgi:hypothetical protein
MSSVLIDTSNSTPLDIVANAAETASPGDDLTVVTGVTVESTGGNITLSAGDNVAIDGTVQATGRLKTVSIAAGSGDLDGIGAIAVDGAISAMTVRLASLQNTNLTGGTVEARVLDLSTQSGGVSQSSGQISAGRLRSSGGIVGDVSLTSAANNIEGLGNIAVASGKFTLNDNTSTLTIDGPVSAQDIIVVNLQAGGSIVHALSATEQAIDVSGTGSFMLTVDGQTTAPLSSSARLSDVFNALSSLPSFSAPNGPSFFGMAGGSGHFVVEIGLPFGDGRVVAPTITATGTGGATATVTTTGASPITGHDVTLVADQMTLASAITATDTILLAPHTPGTPVALGDGVSAPFALGETELATLSAPTLAIGKDDSGTVTAGPITIGNAAVASSTLNLFSLGGVESTGVLTVAAGTGTLDVDAGGTVLLGTGVDVGAVGGKTTSGDFIVSGVGAHAMAAHNIATAGGNIVLGNLAGPLTIDGLLAGAENITLAAPNVTFEPSAQLAVILDGAGSAPFGEVHVNGTVDIAGATLDAALAGGFNPTVGQAFTIIDNDGTDAVTGTFVGLAEGAFVNIGGTVFAISYHGGDGNDVVLDVLQNHAPVNTVPGTQSAVQDTDLAIAGLSVADQDAANGILTTMLAVSHGSLTVATSQAALAGNGTGTVTLSGTLAQIDATLGSVVYHGAAGFTGTDTLTITTSDNGFTGLGGPMTDTDTVKIDVTTPVQQNPQPVFGTPGDDSFTAPAGDSIFHALGGVDTISFGFRLVDAKVSFAGNEVIIDGPNGTSHTVLTGFEIYKFTDGTVNDNDGDPLVDDLFYYSQYHDAWNAQADADMDYHTLGWHAGRDPDAFFSTSTYLSLYSDVKQADIDPLVHFDQFGWKEGRAPSIAFNAASYLDAYPDVKAAGVDPLAQFLQYGEGEFRQPFAFDHLLAANSFDYVYYLQHNPDVAAAHIDPLQHFETIGWKEGRNPSAFFDTAGYLSHYADVAAAGVNPLDHYDQFGWKEGRDPSVNFDTRHYLATYSDVAAAHIDPLTHFVQFGQAEGRSSFADGAFA